MQHYYVILCDMQYNTYMYVCMCMCVCIYILWSETVPDSLNGN